MEPEDVLLAHAASGAGVLGDTHKDTARRIEEVRAAYVSLRSRLAEAAAGMEQAERERDEARATLRAAANRARGIAQSAAADEQALAVLGPLVAERDSARADVVRYGWHEARCPVRQWARDWASRSPDTESPMPPCDCGFAEALARAGGR